MAYPPSPVLIPSALTSVDAVLAWIPNAQLQSGPELKRQITGLINSASRAILSITSRGSVNVRQVTETRTGYNQPSLFLSNWPVLEFTSMTIDGQAVTSVPTGVTGGYNVDPWDGDVPGRPQMIHLLGSTFPSTPNSIVMSYVAGYGVFGESHTVGSTGEVWPEGPLGRYSANWKVLSAAGAVLSPTTSLTPSAGQYKPPDNDAEPYRFNNAQGVVSLYYSFCPAEMDYACAKWVGEWLSYRLRIGQRTISAGGQVTTSYEISEMPADVKRLCNQFSRVAPY